MKDDVVEAIARKLCEAKGLTPDALYQHNFEGDYPTDERTEYKDAFTGEMRTMLFHRAWRHHEKAARAILPIAMNHAAGIAEGYPSREMADLPVIRGIATAIRAAGGPK